MEYRIIICDDEKLHRDILVEHIEGYFADRTSKYEIIQASSGEEAFGYGGIDTVDIAFLDIELGDIEGIELSKRLKAVNDDALIVFVTSYPDYMSEAFEQFAFNYIMKPINDRRFRQVMDKATDIIKGRKDPDSEKFYKVIKDNIMTSIPYNDIVFIGKDKNDLIIILENNYFKLRGSFRKVEREIDMDFFLRCHKSYIINKKKIINKKWDYLTLAGYSKEIPIGDLYRENVLKEISKIKERGKR